MVVTALQLVVLVAASALRGAEYQTTSRLLWFLAAAALLIVVTYGLAEILATRLTSAEEYTGVIPAIAIVPFFFAGSLYPITSLPSWLADVAKVLPLTHALALFRYGLTAHGGQALHNIWGMSNDTTMAALSTRCPGPLRRVILGGCHPTLHQGGYELTSIRTAGAPGAALRCLDRC